MRGCCGQRGIAAGLNESPSEKEGKYDHIYYTRVVSSLNESPSEKEGKCTAASSASRATIASMKAPPKRKGNA